MIDIYFFVNPLGALCFELEKELLTQIKSEYSTQKINCCFLSLVNFQTISDIMQKQGLPLSDLKKRNELYEMTYSAALDVKAAQVQGKKKGHHFLIKLQEAVGLKGYPYSKKLSEHIFQKIGGDLAMFKEDRASEFVKEAFMTDQQVAREMGISLHPSAVVYNYSCGRDFGVLVEGDFTIKKIKELCKTKPLVQVYHDGNQLHKKAIVDLIAYKN